MTDDIVSDPLQRKGPWEGIYVPVRRQTSFLFKELTPHITTLFTHSFLVINNFSSVIISKSSWVRVGWMYIYRTQHIGLFLIKTFINTYFFKIYVDKIFTAFA